MIEGSGQNVLKRKNYWPKYLWKLIIANVYVLELHLFLLLQAIRRKHSNWSLERPKYTGWPKYAENCRNPPKNTSILHLIIFFYLNNNNNYYYNVH